MTLTASRISGHANAYGESRLHARALLDAHHAFPRLSSVFATEQRAMMASIVMTFYFNSISGMSRGGIVLARFLDQVEARGVASRNTADKFIKEMIQYGYLRPFGARGDRRIRPLEPTETALAAFVAWGMAHLGTLDRLDNGTRCAVVRANPGQLLKLQPLLEGYLVGDGSEAVYSETLGLFAWVNNSKLLTLRILGGMGDLDPATGRISTDIDSIPELAKWMGVSQTHLSRKMREAEEIGSVGWNDRRGRSPMWISAGFLKEMLDEVAERLATFDAAYKIAFPDV